MVTCNKLKRGRPTLINQSQVTVTPKASHFHNSLADQKPVTKLEPDFRSLLAIAIVKRFDFGSLSWSANQKREHCLRYKMYLGSGWGRCTNLVPRALFLAFCRESALGTRYVGRCTSKNSSLPELDLERDKPRVSKVLSKRSLFFQDITRCVLNANSKQTNKKKQNKNI